MVANKFYYASSVNVLLIETTLPIMLDFSLAILLRGVNVEINERIIWHSHWAYYRFSRFKNIFDTPTNIGIVVIFITSMVVTGVARAKLR